ERDDRPSDRTPSARAETDERAQPAAARRGHALRGPRAAARGDGAPAPSEDRADASDPRPSGRPGPPDRRRPCLWGPLAGAQPGLNRPGRIPAPGTPRRADTLPAPRHGSPAHRAGTPPAGPHEPPRAAPPSGRDVGRNTPFCLTVPGRLHSLLGSRHHPGLSPKERNRSLP